MYAPHTPGSAYRRPALLGYLELALLATRHLP